MGRAASKSNFQDSSLHSADISTARWCLSFHLCTTISCPLHQVKNKTRKPNHPTQPVFSVTWCCWSMASEGWGWFFSLVGSVQTWFLVSAQCERQTCFLAAVGWRQSCWVAQRLGSPNIFLQFSREARHAWTVRV